MTQVDLPAEADIPQSEHREYLQVLDAQGVRSAEPELDPWLEDVDDDALSQLYRDMVLIRRLDTEATHLQRQGQLALWPPLLGQEAAQAGSAAALREDDFVFPSYRENGVALLRGVDALGLIRLWRGSTFSGWDPKAHKVAAQQIIIGAQALHATGYAMGAAMDGDKSATIVYFGDGATSQGDVNEAMVFAATYKAPVVFFCQNNHWAISEPVTLQSPRHLADRPWGFGVPSLRVDGNDVLAVLAATRRAVERAANGGGPTFIEAVTYRMGPHTTADDPTRYRSDEEVESWKAKDPIDRVAAHLRANGVDMDALEAEATKEADALAADVRAALEVLEEAGPDALFTEVYAEPHQELARQRRESALYHAMFDEEGQA
ncbi:Pyruvate dehydrogenase E1 component alpha subunit [Micrococcus lylae]|uniref:Pyruvate dehydrogenase (Acetyl-transferring) E1 component subunit alpha n=1 Tax=Micrococcus lylae TaxID=1273 RepID=A0A1R4IN27_9MICC|nr:MULTISPECIES: pyruvate dehydrogenase (acetyl-transferring) E1 component subunit alpha [Micrococcus]OFR91267.1 pyruvate dehydrogenase (acetyl-transferring) E1 component subunit alpha [Micrococcus sp. HMSC067E09]PNL17607.1 pyruvate dehydrogenase (acetyl-transferring) E1 component subunit alpha [Micrococcus sp. FDAARGOS_333]TFH98270.1 pyruvate dehydrogenase (acetyl-transferring) E1 component subunit alpha [Micrococcus lylae]SJN21280.1 Pyruvate dehydrogenase E1 component alpha subunit [Micrococc